MAEGDARHSRRRLLGRWGPVLLVLVVLASAFASFEYDVPRRLGWQETPAPEQVAPPAGLELPELPPLEPVAAELPQGSVDPAKVRRALRPFLRDPDIGEHVAAAVGSPDGALHLDTATGPAVPASTIKLLTGLAALESLGPHTRFATTVVAGKRPGEIVLVGGGDPYLERRPSRGADEVLRADLLTLAGETARALRDRGRTRVRLDFDDSLFTGPVASRAWEPSYLPDEVVSPITALWVDEGREENGSGFEDDPSAAAAEAFAAALRRRGIEVRGEPTRVVAGNAVELARVEGPTVREIVEHVLAVSDNEGAEVLAHQIGIAAGTGGSFAGGARATRTVLERLGVPFAGARIRDGSGLSRRNRLTAETLLAVLAVAADPSRPALGTTITGLPVAGFTGSLASRFDDVPTGGPGRVRAKTGTLSGVHGLAGITTDLDGNLFTFAFLTDEVALADTLDARATLDDLASALASCHCS